MPIRCTESELEGVKAILQAHIHDAEVWAFGSRVHGYNLKPQSDLDLVIKSDQPLTTLNRFELQEAFSNSNLPFRVDLVEWSSISDSFKAIIDAHCERVF